MNKTGAVIAAVIVILIVGIASFAYISANSHNTKIDVLSNGTLKNGQKVEIQLVDEYRNAYPNEVIDIKILGDTGWGNKYQVTTDSEGKATVVLEAFENGNYTVYCNYNGTLFNKESKSVTPLKIDDGLG